MKAFQNLVSRMDKQELLEIKGERMSLSDRINEIMERLAQVQPLMFTDIIEEAADKRSVIYTLLAILELMKLRMVKAYQSGPFGVIKIFTAF